MPAQKIKFKELLEKLVDEVRAIEDSDDEQRVKTQKFKAAGSRFFNAIYGDQRKYSGQAGKKKQISLNTLNTYLSRARGVFEDMGLRHHLLDRDLERLQKRYPGHADQVAELVGKSAKETRLGVKALSELLTATEHLQEQLSRIDFDHPAAGKSIKSLQGKFPQLAGLLGELLGEEGQQAMAQLQANLDEITPLLADLGELKVNHEIMYSLVMPKSLRKSHSARKEKALADKKRSVVALDYPVYMQRIYNLLTNPTVNTGDGTRFGISPLCFAVCAVTGRRPIEVLVQGEFEAIDSHLLRFYGQAKKRHDNDEGRDIYCLVDSAVVMKALENLRAIPEVASLLTVKPEDDGDYRDFNVMVNQRVASPLNTFAKDFFTDDRRVFKDTRSIYAAIAYRAWFETDQRWAKKDADVFFAELLGHDDETTQMHYKQWKLANFDPAFLPVESGRRSRLERLAEYDDQMPGLANGNAAVDIHNTVKQMLVNDPETKITLSMVSRATGAYRPTIHRYLTLTATALGIERQENGRWRQVDEAEPPVMTTLEVDDDQAAEALPVAKPRFDARHLHGERWAVTIRIGGDDYDYLVDAADSGQAMLAAWQQHQARPQTAD